MEGAALSNVRHCSGHLPGMGTRHNLRLHRHQTRCHSTVLSRVAANRPFTFVPPYPLLAFPAKPISDLLGAAMQGTRSGGLFPRRGGLS